MNPIFAEANNTIKVRGRKLRDLTNVETVYNKTIQTVSLKVNRTQMKFLDKIKVLMPSDLTEVLDSIYTLYDDDQEHLVMLVLNGGGDITGFKLISTGAQDRALADARVIFRNALMLGAAAIILVHNHPSGDVRPSQLDMEMTKKLAQAGDLMDVTLLDHIIYTPKHQLSLKEVMPSLFEVKSDEKK